ncbi:MAG: DMT family transporter [Alphaproteobacteria bacterium]|nr:DMT family transporter [Alphaproteobacteria bacterium]
MSAGPSPAGAGLQDRPLRGIVFMILAFLCVSMTDALSKAALQTLSTPQMLALRSALVLMMLLPVIARSGGIATLRTGRPGEHLIRVGLSLVSMFCFFEALRHLELATAIAIGFVAPLMMTAMSVPLLGERVGLHRWSAIVVGFIGALVILRPGSEGFQPAAVLAVVAAAAWAGSMVLVRRLSRTDSDAAGMTFQNVGVLLVMGILAPFAWRPMGLSGFVIIVFMALTLMVGQWFMFRAFRLAPVGVVAPFQYLELVGATLFGWLIWDEFPDGQVWVGAGILIASGLYVIWRERVRAAESAARAATGSG